jgi:hypothetical protein
MSLISLVELYRASGTRGRAIEARVRGEVGQQKVTLASALPDSVARGSKKVWGDP